jgi:hypothetical protein
VSIVEREIQVLWCCLFVNVWRFSPLPVFLLYRRGTCSLTLQGDSRIRVLEKRGLGRIFGCKREEVTGR